jgi:DNA-binding CsgD family transcriptional regulator
MRSFEIRELLSESIIDSLSVPILLLDAHQRVLLSNREYCRAFKVQSSDCVGHPLSKLGDGQWNIKSLRARLNLIVPKNEAFKNFEISVDFPKIGRRTMLIGALRLRDNHSARGPVILMTFEDVTERRKNEIALRAHAEELVRINRDLEKFAYLAANELLVPMRNAVKQAEMITSRYKWNLTSAEAVGGRMIDIDAGGLTPREREILILVTDGASNKEIAQKLMIGVRTVETHRQSLMMKLGIRTSAGLTKYALACGLIKLK